MPDEPGNKPRTWWIDASSDAVPGDPASVPFPETDLPADLKPAEDEQQSQPEPQPLLAPGVGHVSAPDSGLPIGPSDEHKSAATAQPEPGAAGNDMVGMVEPLPASSTHDHAAAPTGLPAEGAGKTSTSAPVDSDFQSEVGIRTKPRPVAAEEPSHTNPRGPAEPAAGRGLIDLYRKLEKVVSAPADTVGLVILTRCRSLVRRGQLFQLKQPKNLIGSGRNAILRLEGTDVREDHAVITFEGRSTPPCFRVHPLGIVEVNGSAVDQPTGLRSGDRIAIGDTEMTFLQVDLR